MLAVGDPAPDFDLQDHTGAQRRLAEYRGRHVVLWFYPKADTPG
jgi:thioredoxin-dependent peroxiredoxin